MTWAPYLDFMDAEGANLGPQVCAANIYTRKHHPQSNSHLSSWEYRLIKAPIKQV